MEWPTKPPLGQGLLNQAMVQDRDQVVLMVGAAYRNLLDEKRKNFGLWHAAMQNAQAIIERRYRELGLEAAPFQERSLWARVTLPGPASDQNGHLRLLQALLTPFDGIVADQILYRLRYGGNVHFEFSGPTGMGKSSCAIALADWIKEIVPTELLKHVSIDLGDLPQKLKGKTPGQTVIQDEFLAMAGEGSRTIQSLFTNIEDTLRASQVNLFTVSPSRKEHNTTQAEFELILWNPEKRFSCFLVWLQGVPHGVVAIPWCREQLWEIYKPWKEENTRRSQAGHFRDHTYIAKTAMRFFADPRFEEYMLKGANKPKRTDFEDALEFFNPEMTASTQADRLVNFMYKASYAFKRLEKNFHDIFGVEPNQGFRNVAKRCAG